jgi:hypothetical protein
MKKAKSIKKSCVAFGRFAKEIWTITVNLYLVHILGRPQNLKKSHSYFWRYFQIFVAFPKKPQLEKIDPNLKIWLNKIPHNVGLLTNQWATQINLLYKLVYASLFFFNFPHVPHENPNLCIIFLLPGRTWVRVARCHSWGWLCGQIAKVILHRGLFDIVLTNRPRHSVASATWCRTVGQRHFGPRKYKACHNDPKLRIPFGNYWVKPRYFLNLYGL